MSSQSAPKSSESKPAGPFNKFRSVVTSTGKSSASTIPTTSPETPSSKTAASDEAKINFHISTGLTEDDKEPSQNTKKSPLNTFFNKLKSKVGNSSAGSQVDPDAEESTSYSSKDSRSGDLAVKKVGDDKDNIFD